MKMGSNHVLCFALGLTLVSMVRSQRARPTGADDFPFTGADTKPVSPNTKEYKRLNKLACSPEFRTLDGSCTNGGERNGDKLWGAAGTAHFTYRTESSSTRVTRKNGRSARLISTVISDQSDNTVNRRGLTEFFVFFGEFLDHNIVSTAFNRAEPLNIPIPKNDRLFANFSGGVLPFTRSERIRELARGGSERAMNTISSALDLSTVYSSSEKRFNFLVIRNSCRLKTSRGNLLPLNTPELENEPSHDDDFFLAGDIRANDHPVLTSIHTIFLREHNKLCEDLFKAFPERSFSDLFELARKVNIAQFQKIVFEEFYPAITGRKLPTYRGYRPNVNPATSDLFSTAGYRIGHTLVGNGVQLRGPGMKRRPTLSFQEMFFRPAATFKRHGLEAFVRGAIDQTAQEVDEKVSNSLRDFLFTNIPEFSTAVDLIALNIQRGRDHALPDFNGFRKVLKLPLARKFSDITSSVSLQSRLSTVYDSPDDVDPWVGMMAEDHVPGSSMGQTVRDLWEREFVRFRDGDRFHYAVDGLFSDDFLRRFPKAANYRKEDGTMKRLLLEHSAITKAEVPGPIFRKGGTA